MHIIYSGIIDGTWNNLVLPNDKTVALIWEYAINYRSYSNIATNKMNQYLSSLRGPKRSGYFVY